MSLEFKHYSVELPSGSVVEMNGAIGEGERVFLSGVSGLGKTTLLKSLLGLYKHNKGTLVLSGENITESAPQDRKIGVCFQGGTCWDHLTVFENIKWALELTKTREDIDILSELQSLGLNGVEQKYPNQLSGGERARVAILRAILCDRKFYVFDEPFNGIDNATKLIVYKKIKYFLEKRRAGALFVSHDQEEIANLSTRNINWESNLKCINF